MTEYVPTTDKVREAYVVIRADGDRRGLPFGKRGEAQASAEFDAWLAAHDREVAVRAWDEGYTVGNAHNGRRDACPYRDVEEAQR